MLQIYLTRHGQDEDNAKGILNGRRNKPLTNLGVSQAKELAKKIKLNKIHFDKIYTSPAKRTRQTAQIIADVLSLRKPTVVKELIERDFGTMTGVPIAKIVELRLTYSVM